MSIIQSLLVILAIIFVGILCERRKFISHNQIEGFEIYLFKIAMPCYLFSSILRHDLATLIQPQYIFGYLCSFFAIALIIFCYFYRKGNLSSITLKILSSVYVNTAIYVLPIITFLLGDPIAGVIGNLAQVLLIQPVFIAILSFINHKEKSIVSRIIAVISAPLVAMPIIGLLFNYLHFTPPEIIYSVIEIFGNGASSIALFVFGLTLGAIKISKEDLSKDLLFIVFIKNFMHPLIAFYIGKYIFSLDGYWLNSLVICASAPPAFIVYLIAKQFSSEKDLVKKIIAISSVVSLVSLVIIILMLR
jgi:malonate transporter and related proteins